MVHIIGALFMLTNPRPFKTEEEKEHLMINFNAVKDTSYLKDFYDDNKDNAFVQRF